MFQTLQQVISLESFTSASTGGSQVKSGQLTLSGQVTWSHVNKYAHLTMALWVFVYSNYYVRPHVMSRMLRGVWYNDREGCFVLPGPTWPQRHAYPHQDQQHPRSHLHNPASYGRLLVQNHSSLARLYRTMFLLTTLHFTILHLGTLCITTHNKEPSSPSSSFSDFTITSDNHCIMRFSHTVWVTPIISKWWQTFN